MPLGNIVAKTCDLELSNAFFKMLSKPLESKINTLDYIKEKLFYVKDTTTKNDENKPQNGRKYCQINYLVIF